MKRVCVGEASWIPTARVFSASISSFFTMLGISTQTGAVEAASAGHGQNQQVPVSRLNSRNTCLLLWRCTHDPSNFMKGASANQLLYVAAFSCRRKRSKASRFPLVSCSLHACLSPRAPGIEPLMLLAHTALHWGPCRAASVCWAPLHQVPQMLIQGLAPLSAPRVSCRYAIADADSAGRWYHGVTAHRCQWRRGVKLSGFNGAAESSSVVSLTPRSKRKIICHNLWYSLKG